MKPEELLPLPAGIQLHPSIRARLDAEAAALVATDIGPLGTDRGLDAFRAFFDWRRDHPSASLRACVAWIEESFEVAYTRHLLATATLEKQLAAEENGDFDFGESVFAADETVIASALGQLLSEGKVDADAHAALAVALSREAHPVVLSRIFGEGGVQAARRRALDAASALLGVPMLDVVAALPSTAPAGKRIRGMRIYGPSVRSEGGPPKDPEVMVKEILEGGERPGGATVSRAGYAHDAIRAALFWRLWEADLRLPGFEEIYFHPTASLPQGTYVVEDAIQPRGSFSRSITIGVEPARLRAICRGEAMAEGIELFTGAVAALVAKYGLDPAPIEAARAALLTRGCEPEILLLATPGDGFELRAYLQLRASREHELVAEYRDARGVRRASARLQGEPEGAVSELKFVKGVVHVVPRPRSGCAKLKFKLADMSAVP